MTIERLQSFTNKVEAYLVAFVLTLGLLMMASVQPASADDEWDAGQGDSWWQYNDDDIEECGDYDGDQQCDSEPTD